MSFRRLFINGILSVAIVIIIFYPSTSWAFGESWVTKCPKCNKVYLHTGNDIYKNSGTKVYVTEDLYYVDKLNDGQWATGVMMRNKNGTYTYLVHHMDGVPEFKKNENMNGKFIGKVSTKVSPHHVHIAFRNASYNSSISWKGGLPQCDHKKENRNLPKFPEKFDKPFIKIRF